MSELEENKKKCLAMVAAWNRWELKGIIDHWADDVVHYSEDQPVDTGEMITRMEAGLRAFPDLRLDVRSILAEGDRVSLRITITATHRGPFGDLPPTNKRVCWHIVEELRFKDGKVVEHWDVMNYLPMLKALEKVPADV
ncbi:ester cyclase [Streptomyces sp. ST2-7A]|uniref:ester cyclase n=1 Tax=Streptomyces sp. ST2-7A TaxID=2907214 RepID=UPI001F1647C3|nr:ester cyclase [Streptomyces sp. ST2-7A]MCE7081115.1 ester cyclase [Streptomyces sp. ST2-7A]